MSSCAARTAFALLSAMAIATPSPVRADCMQIDKDLRVAVREGDKNEFPDLHKRMLADPTCDGPYRQSVGRVLALAQLKSVRKEAGEGNPLPREELEVAARYGQPWQVMSALGDADYDAKRWSEAVQAYEAALDDLRDEVANPKAPERAIEERMAKRAYQARALAPTYVATRRFRGMPSGTASPRFRSFTAEVVPVPIRFPYNQAVLTPEGQAAAKDILDFLSAEKAGSVRLIGHTDPRGSDASNMKLSEERARAVGNFLKQYGYGGAIMIVARGEREPFQPDDSSKYNEDERFAFDRRVEYQPGAR